LGQAFVNELAADRAEGVIAGPADGTRDLMIVRQRVGPCERGWLHRHDADQVMRVLSGSLPIAVGDEELRCERGTVAVIAPGTWHGFLGGEDEALLEVIGNQQMRTYLAVREPTGSLTAREVHRRGVPGDAQPPPGSAHTTEQEMADIVNQAVTPGRRARQVQEPTRPITSSTSPHARFRQQLRKRGRRRPLRPLLVHGRSA
jgi:quercetin dioxygenase-like cupin family protein